jgi:hypothetical protein
MRAPERSQGTSDSEYRSSRSKREPGEVPADMVPGTRLHRNFGMRYRLLGDGSRSDRLDCLVGSNELGVGDSVFAAYGQRERHQTVFGRAAITPLAVPRSRIQRRYPRAHSPARERAGLCAPAARVYSVILTARWQSGVLVTRPRSRLFSPGPPLTAATMLHLPPGLVCTSAPLRLAECFDVPR